MPKKTGTWNVNASGDLFSTVVGTATNNGPPVLRYVNPSGEVYYIRPKFSGTTYDPKYDEKRLTGQWLRIKNLMEDGVWRTLGEIAEATMDPEASVSARLRDFRKKEFGSWRVNRRSRGPRKRGLFEYRLEKK